MDISKHISLLLTFNECVIIPDFGSFLSNYVPSLFDPAKNAYLPPTKEIVFNSKITKNDGLLINHLVESESITYTQAYQAVSNWVNSAFDTLNDGEKLEFHHIGVLEFDHNGSFIFTSSATNTLAVAYGLEPVSYPRLMRPVYTDSYNPRPAVKAVVNKKNAIRIAAAIALVLSLSLFPMKLKKEHSVDMSNMNPFTAVATETTSEPVAPKAEAKEVMPEVKAEPVVEKGKYTLVGGSFGVLENAETLCSDLIKEGNTAEIIDMNDGRHRVIFNSYNNRDEALTAMENYRASHPGSQVWVTAR